MRQTAAPATRGKTMRAINLGITLGSSSFTNCLIACLHFLCVQYFQVKSGLNNGGKCMGPCERALPYWMNCKTEMPWGNMICAFSFKPRNPPTASGLLAIVVQCLGQLGTPGQRPYHRRRWPGPCSGWIRHAGSTPDSLAQVLPGRKAGRPWDTKPKTRTPHTLKCCACQQKCKSSSENDAPVTQNDFWHAIWNLLECHEVPTRNDVMKPWKPPTRTTFAELAGEILSPQSPLMRPSVAWLGELHSRSLRSEAITSPAMGVALNSFGSPAALWPKPKGTSSSFLDSIFTFSWVNFEGWKSSWPQKKHATTGLDMWHVKSSYSLQNTVC